jgi:hypothetical protein
MNERIALLRERRQLLQLRAEAQRVELEAMAGRARRSFAVVEAAAAALRLARRHPIVTAVGLVVVFRLARHPAAPWILRLATAFRLFRHLDQARGG